MVPAPGQAFIAVAPLPRPELPKRDSVNLERLIFLKPMNNIKFKLSTEKAYQPGDNVELGINVAQDGRSGEKFYASIVVTDTSSFLKIPKYKQAPSVPTMIYLEKELKQPDGQVNEFQYSDEYIDSLFNPLPTEDKYENADNLDILLAIQSWRRLLLDDRRSLEGLMNNMPDGNDKLALMYLNSKK